MQSHLRCGPSRSSKDQMRRTASRVTGPTHLAIESRREAGADLFGEFSRQGVVAVFDDDFLALLGDDELEELSGGRVEGFAGGFVDVDVEEAGERVAAVEAILVAGFGVFRAFGGDGEGADAGGDVTDAGVAEAEFVSGDALNDGGGAGLFFDGGFEVALAEGGFLEEAVGAGGAVAAVEGDGAAIPGREAGLAPVGKIGRSAEFAGRREDGVDLGEVETLEGVVFVGEDGEGVDCDTDGGGFVAEFGFEGVDFLLFHFTAHGAELSGAFDEGGGCSGGAFAFNLDTDVGVFGAETLGPEGHEVVEGIGADGNEAAGDAAGGLVFGQGGVDFNGEGGGR
jgi:hypothetical protein